MGKAKKRSIALGKHKRFENLSREEAIEFVLQNITDKNDIVEVISLFGLKAEELLVAGAEYEEVMALGSLLK